MGFKKGNKFSVGIGAPTKFLPEYCQAIVDYFTVDEVFREHADKNGKIQLLPIHFRMFEKFAASIHVSDDTVVEWTKHPEYMGQVNGEEMSFSSAYTRAKQLQKAILAQGAMSGAFAPQFSIFLAKNITDWKDKQEVEGTLKILGNKISLKRYGQDRESRSE